MAGSLMYRPAPDRQRGTGSSFLRFPVLRPGRRSPGASGIAQHHAVPDLLDGSVGRGPGIVHYVFLRLPPSPTHLAAANTPPAFSGILPVVRTSSSHFLASFCS